jgi:hypothetical protein
MFCINCGTQLPDNANFCLKCGTPQANGAQASASRPIRWEYKDLRVPVDLRWGNGNIPDRIYSEADKAVLQSLQEQSKDGWECEGTSDIRRLLRLDKTEAHYKSHWLTGFQSIDSIKIRLKRLVP